METFLKQFKIEELNEKTFDLKPSISLALDTDGSLLLKKHENVNLQNIYNNSKELIKEYDSYGNDDSVKYELCKLWMLSLLIERKINSKFTLLSNKHELVKLRAHVLNTFKTYLRKLLQRDKQFNFNKYFNDSQFGIEVYKIDKRLIDSIKSFII